MSNSSVGSIVASASRFARMNASARSKVSWLRMEPHKKELRMGSAAASRPASLRIASHTGLFFIISLIAWLSICSPPVLTVDASRSHWSKLLHSEREVRYAGMASFTHSRLSAVIFCSDDTPPLAVAPLIFSGAAAHVVVDAAPCRPADGLARVPGRPPIADCPTSAAPRFAPMTVVAANIVCKALQPRPVEPADELAAAVK
mmetsp:Transcript_248/g.664  ORF Transcript_248/g.664 Transcript_248/m.664 type:complete len:202 (-) Transcript_248:121-726(-)